MQCVSTAIIMVIMATAVHAQTPVLKWEYRHNGPGNQNDRFNDLKVDAQLNAYVTGYRMGQTTNFDYLTAKVDNDGNEVWAQPYNGPGNGLDEAYKLVMDNAGAVYVTGKSLGNGTGFDWATIKYNNSGTQQWAERFNEPNATVDEIPYNMDINGAGSSVYVTGTGPSSWQFPNTRVIKTRSYNTTSGVNQSIMNVFGWGTDPYGIIADAGGLNWTMLAIEEYANNNQYSRMTFKYLHPNNNPGQLAWPTPATVGDFHGPNGAVKGSSNEQYVFGFSDVLSGAAQENVQAVALKISGSIQWATTFGGSGTGRDEALDAKEYNGDLYVVGYADMDATAGVNNDFLIARINGSTGAVTWQQTYDRGNDDRAFKVHVSSLGNIYVMGQTVNASGNKDITLLMYNNSGQLQWERHYNGPGNGDDIPTGLHVSTDANDITISGHSVGNGSQEDAIVLRYCTPPIPDAGPDKGFCSGGSTTIGSAALPNHTYEWTPATGLSSATAAQPTLTLTNTTDCPVNHQYIVKVTRQGGCFDYDTVNVTVYHNPVVSIAASSPNPVCQGQGTVTLTPNVNTGCSGTPSYAWKLGTQTVSTSASAYSVSQVNQSGSYTLEVTNNHGGTSCSTTSNAVTGTVNPLPVGSASAANLCSQGTTSIALSSSITGTTYAWTSAVTSGSVSGHSSGSGSTIGQTLVGDGVVTYTVTPTANGCEGQPFTVTATVAASLPQPQVTASGTTQLCPSGSVTLNAPAGFSYQWLLNGSNISGATSSSYTATTAGSYTVTVTQGNCTATSVPTQVTVNAAPTASITGSNSVCTGSSAQLTANATPGSTLAWSGPGVDGLTTPNVSAGQAGNYTVTATNNGCSTTSSTFTVTEAAVPTVPTVSASGALEFCAGGNVQLSVSNASGCIGCNYTWQPSGSGASISASQSGSYVVTATNDCGTQVSEATAVTVNPLPVADAGTDQTITPPATTAQLTGSASGGSGSGYQYSWSPATGLSSPNADSTSASPTHTTPYTLTVTDSNGCTDTDVVTVTVGPIVDCDNSAFSTNHSSMIIPMCGASPAVLGISLWQPQQTGCTWEVNAVGDCDWIHDLQPVGPQLSSGSIIFDVDPNDSETMRTCSLVVTVGTVARPPIIVNQIGGCGVSIEESEAGGHGLVIAPNPTSGTFDLLLPDHQSRHRYEVFSPIGQLIQSGTITSERTAIDLQGAAAGIYTLRVLDGNGQMMGVKRVVVQ